MNWQLFLNDGTLQGPPFKQGATPDAVASCEAYFRQTACVENSTLQNSPLLYGVERNPDYPPFKYVVSFEQSHAAFMLARGPYAWFGYSWVSCAGDCFREPPQCPGRGQPGDPPWNQTFPDFLKKDYGVPLGRCNESPARSGIFTREWSKAKITLNCKTWSSSIAMKSDDDNSASPGCPVGCAVANHGACTCGPSIKWSVGFDSDMVLQRAGGPAGTAATVASVYGLVLSPAAKVSVIVTDESGKLPPYSAPTTVAFLPVENRVAPGSSKGWKPPLVNYTATFKATLKPHPAGGSFTITAVCTSGCFGNATRDAAPPIQRATFGDVYFCGGQSNMALPLIHTFSAKTLQTAMRSGAYSQLRFFSFGGMSSAEPSHSPIWARDDGAVSYDNKTVTQSDRPLTWFNVSFASTIEPHCCYSHTHISQGPFMDFSSTCMEFGRHLIEQLGNESAPPIGLISSNVGGTTIEAWSPNATTASCQNKTTTGPTASPPGGHLFYGMTCPFANTTISGWTWYQGENDMHGSPGSSLQNAQGGGGCE